MRNTNPLCITCYEYLVYPQSYILYFFRLEIGVQSVYEDIARDTNRGHTVKAVCENFNMAKDSGYKVNYIYLICLLSFTFQN